MASRMITNFDELATSDLRRDALSIAEAGYAAINIKNAIAKRSRIDGEMLVIDGDAYPLADRRVFFVGIGKCAIAAGEAVEALLGERLTDGIALDVSPVDEHALKKVRPFIGTHPLPSDVNEQATGRILAMLADCREDDLVLMLVSGGGSTLLCSHEQPMTCLDESFLFTALTSAGATIQELNTARKHISLARGGGLARAAYPAEVVSLVVSDVPGNNLEFIASGPTVRDDSTVADARAVLEKYQVTPPDELVFVETPKEEKYFARVHNRLFLSNDTALAAMQDEAVRRDYAASVATDRMSGEAGALGKEIAAALHSTPEKTVLLYAGESTVTLGAHPEKGGRNQEMALAALPEILEDELILPVASDGHDNTDHAGAIADTKTREAARAKDISIEDALARHASYDFCAETGSALITGYTGSNVSDFIIAIKQ